MNNTSSVLSDHHEIDDKYLSGGLNVKKLILKWTQDLIMQAYTILHKYYDPEGNPTSYIPELSVLYTYCDELLEETPIVENILLDLVCPELESIDDIITVVYGITSDEVFVWRSLKRLIKRGREKYESEGVVNRQKNYVYDDRNHLTFDTDSMYYGKEGLHGRLLHILYGKE